MSGKDRRPLRLKRFSIEPRHSGNGGFRARSGKQAPGGGRSDPRWIGWLRSRRTLAVIPLTSTTSKTPIRDQRLLSHAGSSFPMDAVGWHMRGLAVMLAAG